MDEEGTLTPICGVANVMKYYKRKISYLLRSNKKYTMYFFFLPLVELY